MRPRSIQDLSKIIDPALLGRIPAQIYRSVIYNRTCGKGAQY